MSGEARPADMAGESSEKFRLLDQLAEEFAERYRRGERPTLHEYTQRHPELAEQIREVFPSLIEIERAEHELRGPVPARKRLGDFLILREVGRGGMGVVYEAEQVSLGRRVALKVLPGHALADPRQVERFEREAKAAARLHHTNIVPVFGVGHEDGQHFYVMQFIHGQPLDAVLAELRKLRQNTAPQGAPTSPAARSLLSGEFAAASGGRQPPGDAGDRGTDVRRSPGSGLSGSGRPYWQSVARMGAQVADALAYAHGQGVLHRDVKPSNLLLDAHGIVWVTDFGLAKAAEASDLTGTGEVVGTLRYIPPERLGGHSDERGDVYSLGLTLYEMLTLRPAFEVEDRVRLIEQILHADPPPPRRLAPDVPRDLETVVLKAMARDPAHRYRTAAELAADLRRFTEDRPVLARRISGAERLRRWCRRNPAVAALMALVFLAMAGGTLVSTFFALLAAGQELRAIRMANQAGERAAGEHAEKERVRRLLYDARMNLAQNAWHGHQPKLLRQLLAELRPADGEEDLRGFEYWYLWRLLHAEARTLRLAENPLVDPRMGISPSYDLSADGGRLATFSLSGGGRTPDGRPSEPPLTVWDTATGRRLFTTGVTLGRGGVGGGTVKISPDGHWVALGGDIVRVWDVDSGREHAPFPLRQTALVVAFDRASRRLAVAEGALPTFPAPAEPAAAPTVHVWDLAERTEVVTLKNLPADRGSLAALAFAPDGNSLLVGADTWLPGQESRSWMALWDLAADRERVVFADVDRAPLETADFSPDGRWLAVGGSETVHVFEAATGKKTPLELAVPYFAGTVRFSPDGEFLAVADSMACDVELFSVGQFLGNRPRSKVSLLPTRKLIGHDLTVMQVAFRDGGRRLVAVDVEGVFKEWDLAAGEPDRVFPEQPAHHEHAFSADGRRLTFVPVPTVTFLPVGQPAPRPSDGELGVWDVERRRVVFSQRVSLTDAVPRTALSPDGTRLALWSMPAGHPVRQEAALTMFPLAGSAVTAADAATAAWHAMRPAAGPSPVQVLEVASGRELYRVTIPSGRVAFSPDGRFLLGGAIGGRGNELAPDFWGPFAGGERWQITPETSAWYVWDAASGRLRFSSPVPGGAAVAPAFHPDGRHLAVWSGHGGFDGELALWDLETGRRTVLQRLADSTLWDPRVLMFNADGSRLVGLASDRAGPVPLGGSTPAQLLVWDATAPELPVIRKASCQTVHVGERGEFPFLAVSPDGRQLAFAGEFQTVTVIDLVTGRDRFTLRGLPGSLGYVGFSGDGRRLLTLGDANPTFSRNGPRQEARVWDLETGQELLTLPLSLSGRWPDTAVRFDGARIVVADMGAVQVLEGAPAKTDGAGPGK